MKRLALLSAASVALLFGSTAHAGSAHEFAEKGQLIFSADRLFPLFSYSRIATSQSFGGTENKDITSGASLVLFYGAEPSASSFNTVPRLAFDYAVINHLTVGGTIKIAFGLTGKNTQESTNTNAPTTTSEIDAPKSTIFGIAPRVGYAIDFTDLIAFWPRVGFSYDSVSTKEEIRAGQNTTTIKTHDSVFSLNVEPMFVLAPFRNVFFMAGPVLDVSLTGSRTVESGNQKNEPDLSVLHIGIETALGVNF